MTNQEILQQVYDSMPNEFEMLEFYSELRKANYNLDNSVEFDKFLNDKSTEMKFLKRVKKPNFINFIDPYKHIQVGTVLVAKEDGNGALEIGKEYKVRKIDHIFFYVPTSYSEEHPVQLDLANKLFRIKPKQVDPLWVYVYSDYYNRLVDIERKYNQLMKSFKEVER